MMKPHQQYRKRFTSGTVSTFEYAQAVDQDPKTIADKCNKGKIAGAQREHGEWRIPILSMPKQG
jgi:hypothetical protein